MSMLNEAILINYKHQKTYSNTALNVIGATTNQSLRTVTTYNNSNCKHVRKFGTDYNITKVTGISDPVDVKMTFKVYSAGGTLLGSRVGGGNRITGKGTCRIYGYTGYCSRSIREFCQCWIIYGCGYCYKGGSK